MGWHPILIALHDGRPVPPAARVEQVPGTQFYVAYPRVAPTPSGPSIGSLVVGIASGCVALIVGCLGVATPVGVAVGGAFAVLGVACGGAAIGLGLAGLRQVRRDGGRTAGRNMAIAGISCGGGGLLLTALALLAAVIIASGP